MEKAETLSTVTDCHCEIERTRIPQCLMQNLILPATQKDQRTRPKAQPLLALLVCFTEMAFMFPAFHTVRSSGLAADGLGAMTGPVIPGAARQDKKQKRNRNEDCKRTANIPHATSCESNMN